MSFCYGCMKEKFGDFKRCDFCGYIHTEEYYKPYYLRIKTKLCNERYELGKVLGSGGFGTTYIAYDHILHERVAVKEYLPKNIIDRKPGNLRVGILSGKYRINYLEGMRRFKEEAQMIKNLNYLSGIVKINNFFEENNTLYIIMEYVEGYTLTQYIERYSNDKRLGTREMLSLFVPFLEVLDKVHKANVFHRDISPDNLIINKENYSLKLIDFGSAKQLSENEVLDNVTISYKEGYTPPEQYLRKEQGAWSDVFSVAASMYKVITGKKIPFTVASLNMEWDGNKPSDLGIDIEASVEYAIMKALEPESEKRFKSVCDFRNALINDNFYMNEIAKREIKEISTNNVDEEIDDNSDGKLTSTNENNKETEFVNKGFVETVTKNPVEDKRILKNLSVKKKMLLSITAFLIIGLVILGTSVFFIWLSAKKELGNINELTENKEYNKAYDKYEDFIAENNFNGLNEDAKLKIENLEEKADEIFKDEANSKIPDDYSGDFKELENFCDMFLVDYRYSKENNKKAEKLISLIDLINSNNKDIDEYEKNREYYEENKKILDTMDYNMNEILEVAENGDIILDILVSYDDITESEANTIANCYDSINVFVANNETALSEMLKEIESDREGIIKSGYFTKDEYDSYVTFINQGLYLGIYSSNVVYYALESDSDNFATNYDYAVESQNSFNSVEDDVVKFMQEKREVIENTEEKVSKKIEENDKDFDEIKDIINN